MMKLNITDEADLSQIRSATNRKNIYDLFMARDQTLLTNMYSHMIYDWCNDDIPTKDPLRLPIIGIIDSTKLDSWKSSLISQGYTVNIGDVLFEVIPLQT